MEYGKRTEPHGRISERHVQAIWYDAALRPRILHATDGRTVEVEDPGSWNLEAGPDFRHAAIRIGGGLRKGDVEVHLRPCDWTHHGHGGDPAYSGVVAHVFWQDGTGDDSLPPGCVRICIGGHFRPGAAFSPAEIDVAAYPHLRPATTLRPCAILTGGNPDAAVAVLREAGRTRMRIKTGKMAAAIRRLGAEQAFYEALFVSLGYKHNRFPFQTVAAALPWTEVPDSAASARICYECIAGMKVAGESVWKLAHVRPANSPARRLAAAAALFSQGPSLAGRMMACGPGTRDGQKKIASILMETRLIGSGRAGAMIANAVIPYAIATGAIGDMPDWIFPEDVSAPARESAYRLLGRDHNPAIYSRNGLLIQGLLHMAKTCEAGGCGTCLAENAISSCIG